MRCNGPELVLIITFSRWFRDIRICFVPIAIKQAITPMQVPIVFHVTSRITILLQIPTMLFQVFQQIALSAIP